MSNQKGTPRTLKEAILNGLDSPYIAALKPTLADRVEKHVQDYLNQRFGVPMLSDNPAVVEAIKKLKDAI